MLQAPAVMQLGKSGSGLLQRALIAWQHASTAFKLHTALSIAQQKPISSASLTMPKAVCTQALPCSTSMCTRSSMQIWAHMGSQPSWHFMHSTLAPIHAQYGTPTLRSYSTAGAEPPSSSGTGEGQGPPKELRMSLHDALVRLVDAAVEMVEAGHTDDAISVLKEGIATFEPNFPDSPELGELQNQVALLSLVAGDADSAALHAATALAITQKHFSAGGPLVAHRQLRLGVANFAQGKLSEAAGLLHAALEALMAVKDTSASEASYYLTLSVLAGTRDVAKVANLEERLLSDIKEMKKTFGADAMIVSLALAQHDRIAHQPLGAAEPDGLLCEALLKQHARLLESVHPEGEDLAVAHYKLGTFYYVHDMLNDAQGYVRKAGTALRATLPEDHALVSMCKHRLGMVCSAQGDHRAAKQLLEESQSKYGGGAGEAEGGQATQTMSGLAREAQLGLAIAKYHALPPSSDASTKKDALKLVRARLDDLVAAIGVNHMLSRGAMRHVARLNAGAA